MLHLNLSDRHIRAFTARKREGGTNQQEDIMIDNIEPGIAAIIIAALWIAVGYQQWIKPRGSDNTNR